MKTGTYFLWIFLVALCSCTKEGEVLPANSSCEKSVVIDSKRFENTETLGYTISNAKINADCLEIELAASGCDGKNWTIDLIDSEIVAGTVTHERYLKISLGNQEDCLTVIKKTISFDLTSIRTSKKQVFLNLISWEHQLIYNR